MEKVKSAGIRLTLIALALFCFSCGEKKQENSAEQVEVTPEIDSLINSNPDQQPAYSAEIFEYRSETLKNYQLYAIYPFQDAPQFLVVRNDEARLLTLDEEKEAEEGQALDDEEFTAAKFLEETESEGITTFNQIGLTTRADVNVVFNHSFTKRTLTIGEQYSYSSEEGSGNFSLAPNGDTYIVAITTGMGKEFCELEGNVRLKGNLAYFKGGSAIAKCKLIFFFTDKKVQVLQVSSSADCNCSANTSLNHQFSKK